MYLDLTKWTCYVNPNNVGVHYSIWFQILLTLWSEYKNNMKPVTCRYQFDYVTVFYVPQGLSFKIEYFSWKVKTQHLHFRWHKLLSFTLEDSRIKIADDQYSSITKGSIYYIKCVFIQPFTMRVDSFKLDVNGSISYVWSLHILPFYSVRQILRHVPGFVWGDHIISLKG